MRYSYTYNDTLPNEFFLFSSERTIRKNKKRISNYEKPDHLGNVRATIKGISTGVYQLTSRTDYYAFGGPMPGRTYNLSTYLYNYQGQENCAGTNWQNFELRMHNSDLGRWMAPDPAGQFYSPYISMGNNPVSGVDPDGGYMYFDKVNHYAKNKYIHSISGAEKQAMATQRYKDELARIYLLVKNGYMSMGDFLLAIDNNQKQYGALQWAISNEGGFEAPIRSTSNSDDGHVSSYDIANAEFEGRATPAIAQAMMMSSYGRSNLMLDDNYYSKGRGEWGHWESFWNVTGAMSGSNSAGYTTAELEVGEKWVRTSFLGYNGRGANLTNQALQGVQFLGIKSNQFTNWSGLENGDKESQEFKELSPKEQFRILKGPALEVSSVENIVHFYLSSIPITHFIDGATARGEDTEQFLEQWRLGTLSKDYIYFSYWSDNNTRAQNTLYFGSIPIEHKPKWWPE